MAHDRDDALTLVVEVTGKWEESAAMDGKLRQAEVLHGQGLSMAEAIRRLGISEVTFYRWRKEYGGMSGDQLRRLKELEKENERLRRAVSDRGGRSTLPRIATVGTLICR